MNIVVKSLLWWTFTQTCSEYTVVNCNSEVAFKDFVLLFEYVDISICKTSYMTFSICWGIQYVVQYLLGYCQSHCYVFMNKKCSSVLLLCYEQELLIVCSDSRFLCPIFLILLCIWIGQTSQIRTLLWRASCDEYLHRPVLNTQCGTL